MTIITKHFETIKQAEKYQFKLYDKYNSVVLISSPLFTESGTYKWKVSE